MPRRGLTGPILGCAVAVGTGLAPLEGYGEGTTPPVLDTSVARVGGLGSYKCVGGATATSWFVIGSTSIGADNDLLSRNWFMINAYSTATTTIWKNGSAPLNSLEVKMTSTGKLQLFRAGVQVGSDSDETVSLDTWHCIQARCGTSGGEALLNGTIIATTATATSYELPIAGWITAPGQTATMWLCDMAVNTRVTTTSLSNWTIEAAYPPQYGHVVRFAAKRVITNTGGWTTCKNTTTEADIIEALGRFPPEGHAHATNHTTAAHQVFCESSDTTSQLLVEGWSFGRGGVPGDVKVDALTGTYLALGSAASTERRSQRFYLTGTVAYVQLSVRKVGSPADTLTVELYADSGGNPTGSALASASVAGADISTTVDWESFTPLDLALTTGSAYHIVVRRSGAVDASNYYEIQTGTITTYGYNDGGSNVYNGAWGTITTATHLAFRAYASTGAGVVNSYMVHALTGENVSTGTKNGTPKGEVPTNTTTTGGTVYGNDLGACGTWTPTTAANWAWKGSLPSSGGASVTSMALAPRWRMSKSDGTTRGGAICCLVLAVEYTPPLVGWHLWNKTADGTDWWAKFCPHTTQEYLDDGTTIVTAEARSWFVAADVAGEPDRSTLTAISDATFRAGYTPL